MRGGGNKEKGVKALAWISFALAAVGGAAVAATFLGGWIANVVGIFPDFIAVLLFAGLLVGLAVDLFNDGVPNQLALYAVMVLPSLARSVPGQVGDSVSEFSNQILAQVSSGARQWLGVSAAIGIAAVAIGVSLVMARRVVTKGR